MTAVDGNITVPSKSPGVLHSLWSKDGTDSLGTIHCGLEKSQMAHGPRPSDGMVDIPGYIIIWHVISQSLHIFTYAGKEITKMNSVTGSIYLGDPG
jgi:hypothetical protein